MWDIEISKQIKMQLKLYTFSMILCYLALAINCNCQLYPRAPAETNCYDCFCQCSSLTFSSYGKIEGNCRSYDHGGRWCYVRNNVGYGYSTCPDQRRSKRFYGRSWSYHACATPSLHSYDCRHCQGNSGHGHGHGAHGRSGYADSSVSH